MGKAGKLRSGSAGKSKRWKKGHSSDSNPELRRHREAARSRFFSRPSGKSDLTVDALKLHNDLQSDTLSVQKKLENSEGLMEDEDEMAITEKSGVSFLSGLSDCTNLTFGKVQRYWESNSAAHKEICAVLAAVTEVIRSQGGKESETEYFAALMTTLEAVESPESLAAVTYLLNLVLKRVPGPVLIKKFSDTSKALMDIMASQASSGSTSAMRWIVSCLAVLLRKQDLLTWSYPSTLQVYHGLLSFTVHAKPKIRKAAQLGVCSILKGSEFMFSESAPKHHPAVQTTAKFCIQEIEKSGGSKEATTTLHMLTLLKELLPCFPVSMVKSCCETLLKVMTLSNVLITACAMQAFHGLFHSCPGTSALTAELNAQIITALYDYLPNENDLQPVLAWLAVMEKAHTNLARLQSELCLGHLPRLFLTTMNCLLSPHLQVVGAAARTLKTLLTECIAPNAADIGSVPLAPTSGPAGLICKMFRCVEEGLSYKFHSSWPYVLQVLQTFFEAAGKNCHPFMRKCLQTLADLRTSAHFSYTGELDHAVGAAVESMGPEVVLKAIPLQIDGTEESCDFPRSWLVPVIRDNVKNTELGFFTKYFLPLAAKLKNRAADLSQDGRNLEAKIYDTLQWQIWTMLPGFCTKPTDVVDSFKGIARTLGMAINDRPDLRLTVCQALRSLINKGCESEADKAEVSRFAKNFLPILFNVYSQPPAPGEGPSQKLPVLDTVKAYLTITDQQMVSGFLDKATVKLTEAESAEPTRLYMLDLIIAMAPYADEPSMTKIYHTILPYLEDKNHSLQKKAYRVLEEICGGEQPPCKEFVNNNLEELKKTLLTSLKSASSPAKRPRLKCLIHIVKQLAADHEEFITSLIPEVMICTREVSVGARKNAYTLLAEIGYAFLRFNHDQKEAMEQYLAVVYAGLTGSVTMISCAVLTLTRLLFEFKDQMGLQVIEHLLENVCLLLGSRTREVVKAALGFIKVIIFIMDIKVLSKQLQMMMEAIGNINSDMRRFFRVKLKNIFTKFIRKFGFELVKSMLPEAYHKVLVNIRKAEARNKKQKALKQAAAVGEEDDQETKKLEGNSMEDILADSDEEVEEDEEKPTKQQKKLARQKSQAWLKEGEEDDPLNFLDPKAAQRVLATRPDGKSTKLKHDFKTSSDGRLIIQDDEVEEDKSKAVDEEMADLMQEVGIRSKKAQKKRFREDNDDDDDATDKKPQYKSGGSGIHRPISKKPESGANYKSKKGKGDVKQKGKHDPFAYIPLNKATLNRRKKAKMQGQFKGLVRAAQRGAQSGLKKRKDRRL
ncbi:RRP12-like protein [Xenopus tropicalis]|uniref:LOC447949 protein n=1 Tax=Xenopus tropicalis TaxID=8364 RepID=A2VCY8_XENTR|nr:RRP12-like protein [Xenopus tropicalis]AAI28998.1 LOC447949 protein [Xenopus tropicalis]|eukprot:NP_001075884.1 RRP12-like protein [Xenopus tropicalis]